MELDVNEILNKLEDDKRWHREAQKARKRKKKDKSFYHESHESGKEILATKKKKEKSFVI